jgi:GNAT superfamily N-acetyltransferase
LSDETIVIGHPLDWRFVSPETKIAMRPAITNEGSEPSPNVAIRLASAADALILARLRYDFRSSLDQIREDEEVFIERCRRWMQERLQDDSPWRCWIAELQGTPVGNIWAQLIEKIPNPVSEPEYHIYITNFYVRDDWRGKGIASR